MIKIPPRPGGRAPDMPKEYPVPENERPVEMLKEGDALSDWSRISTSGCDVRYVLGKQFWWKRCQWCSTRLHRKIEERRRAFVGRDKIKYECIDRIRLVFGVCPRCGYEQPIISGDLDAW